MKETYKQARDAYIGRGDWFQKWNTEQEQKCPDFPWLVLSAKYGFIEPEHPIHNYDVTFSKRETGPISLDSLRNQACYQCRGFGGQEKKLCDFNYVLVKSNVTKGKDTYVEKVQAAFYSIADVRKLTDELWNKIVANLAP